MIEFIIGTTLGVVLGFLIGSIGTVLYWVCNLPWGNECER
jgi:ABC-type dipeptide/oligopeptide/nickel transport system permease subunit